MFTEIDLQAIRKSEPLFREGMTAAEIIEDMQTVAEWDDLMDKWREAGHRPKSEQLIDHATAKRRAQDAARARKYRRNKATQKQPNVTHLVAQ
jgi:hypothetical protein